MQKLISIKAAVAIMLLITSATIVFHLLVMAGVFPPDIVWGGNITNRAELMVMESISIGINVVILLFVLAYAGKLKIKLAPSVAKGGFWFLFALFALNTIGNLLAKHSLETYIFTPITFLLALCCFRIAAFSKAGMRAA